MQKTYKIISKIDVGDPFVDFKFAASDFNSLFLKFNSFDKQ